MEDKKCPCETVLRQQDELQRQHDRLADGAMNFALVDARIQNIETGVTEIRNDLKGLMEKPGKRMEGLSTKIVDYIVLAVLAVVLVKVGLM